MKDQEQEEVVLPAGIASAKKGLQKVNLEAALFLEMPWDRGVGDQLDLEELSWLEEVQQEVVSHWQQESVGDLPKPRQKIQAAHYS